MAARLTRASSGLYSVSPGAAQMPATPMKARSQFIAVKASSAIPPVRLSSPCRTCPPVTTTRISGSLPSSTATGSAGVTTVTPRLPCSALASSRVVVPTSTMIVSPSLTRRAAAAPIAFLASAAVVARMVNGGS